MDHLCYFSLALLCFHARLFVDALWSPIGKGTQVNVYVDLAVFTRIAGTS